MTVLQELVEPTLRMFNAERNVRDKQTSRQNVSSRKRLHQANVLYRHLEMDDLIAAFANRLSSVVPLTKITFTSTLLDRPFCHRLMPDNEQAEHQLEYIIDDDKGALGSLVVARAGQFLSAELRYVNLSVDSLVGPLRNATLYRQACQTALIDKLTGLQNRTALDDALSREPLASPKLGKSLLVCDVDRFKRINDCFGHRTGDMVLRQFARVLRVNVPETDEIYRYGGDEFVVILKNASPEKAAMVAEQISQAIRRTRIQIDNKCIDLTTTIGLTTVIPGESLDEGFLRADQALLFGKRAGKNQLVVR